MTNSKIKNFIFLHIILIVYSLGSIISKLASEKNFLSFEFILYYGLVLIIMLLYAILWQQILKRMPLTTAFANKSVTVIWGMIWGALIFNEVIKINMIVGSLIIFLGVYLVVSDDE